MAPLANPITLFTHSHEETMRTPPVVIRHAAAVLMAGMLVAACSRDAAPPASSDESSVGAATRGFVAGGANAGIAGRAAPPPAPHAAVVATAPIDAADATDAPAGVTVASLASASGASRLAADDAAAGAMLVRTGTASVQVDSLDPAIARLRQIAARVGGVVADVSVETGKNQNASASIELRIPSPRFDEAVNGLAPLGKVEAVNVAVEDVGEEFVDVTARVENAKRLEARLVELLATRTGKLGDVLQVERELARVREEIERYEGRLRYLRARASISRLTVTVHEPLPLVAANPADHPIRDAFKQTWRNFVGVVAAIIASLGALVPLGAIALGAWVALRGRLPTRAKAAAVRGE